MRIIQVTAQMDVANAEIKLLEERLHATENGTTASCRSGLADLPGLTLLFGSRKRRGCAAMGACVRHDQRSRKLPPKPRTCASA